MSSGGEAVFAAAGPRSAAEDELAAAAAVLAVDGTTQDTLDSELCGTENRPTSAPTLWRTSPRRTKRTTASSAGAERYGAEFLNPHLT